MERIAMVCIMSVFVTGNFSCGMSTRESDWWQLIRLSRKYILEAQ